MSDGRDPWAKAYPTGGGPSGGLFSGANLPYSLAIVLSISALVGYVLVASPFASSPSRSATTVAATGGGGDAAEGEVLFNVVCAVCHAPGGVGISGLGKPLTTSEFASGLTDDELLAFLITGRPSDDPLNTTGIAMPPRGGGAGLSDAELVDVIAYVRTLNPG